MLQLIIEHNGACDGVNNVIGGNEKTNEISPGNSLADRLSFLNRIHRSEWTIAQRNLTNEHSASFRLTVQVSGLYHKHLLMGD